MTSCKRQKLLSRTYYFIAGPLADLTQYVGKALGNTYSCENLLIHFHSLYFKNAVCHTCFASMPA